MIKLLPFILIPILLIAGLGYWRFVVIKQSITPVTQNSSTTETSPVEVPKTLPKVTLSPIPTPAPSSVSNTSQSDSRLTNLERVISELKARISVLEKPTPVVTSSKAATIYIPLGSSGGPWVNSDWTTLSEYQVSLDPANFPGYSSMVLELTSRMIESGAIAYIRLYNNSDGSTTSSEVKTTTTSFGLYTSSSFTLSTGSKNYVLQVKSPDGKNLILQTARIRVAF